MNNKISVIMTAYNEEKEWVESAIESILCQTYKNFEYIIILDNPDNMILKKCIEKYSSDDDRIKFYVNKKNIGLTKSLNLALSIATGDYIARMDADDISLNDRFEKQINYMIHNDVDLLGGNALEFSDTIIGKTNLPLSNEDICSKIRKYNVLIHPTWFAKKSVFDMSGGYRNMPATEDYDFLLRIVKKKIKIANLGDVLLKYRIRSNSVSRKNLLKQRLAAIYLSDNIERIEKIEVEDVEKYVNTKLTKKREFKYQKGYELVNLLKKEKNIIKKIYYLLSLVLIYNIYLRYNKIRNCFIGNVDN